MSLEEAVREAVAGLDLTPTDAGAVELAYTYAAAIDSREADIARVGPALLACLESLGMTPRARAALAKGVTDAARPVSPLDELRARRSRRLDPATTVDTSTG